MSAKNKIEYDTSLSADIVIFTVHEDELKILLVKRAHVPYEGKWALPGGFRKIGVDKTLDDIAIRRLKEETGTKAPYLEQLYTFGSDIRDPRHWVTTVAYFAFMPHAKVRLMVGEGVTETKWWPVRGSKVSTKLAFDHNEIVKVAVKRIRSKMEYSSIAAHLLGDEFTLPALQKSYEIILGCALDKTYFRRAIKKADIVIDTKRFTESKGYRPAAIYRFKKGTDNKLFFPRGLVRSSRKKEES